MLSSSGSIDGVFNANNPAGALLYMFILESTTKNVSRGIEVSVVFISIVAAFHETELLHKSNFLTGIATLVIFFSFKVKISRKLRTQVVTFS